MRLPNRKGPRLQRDDEDGAFYVTPSGYAKLQRIIENIERDMPKLAEEKARAAALGDRSENAEYQEAKARLSRMQSQLFYTKEKLKRAVLIEESSNAGGTAQIGSTVTVSVGDKERVYEIVGSYETNPGAGRISHHSPLGKALIGHGAGETVTITTERGTVTYTIVSVA